MRRVCAASGYAVVLLALSLDFSVVGAGSAQATPTILVSPGDTVSIPQPIQNAADSGGTINNVQVTLTSTSPYATNITPSFVASIASSCVSTFTPTFVVDPNAQSGSFTLNVITTIGDVGIDPDPATQVSTVSFTIDRSLPAFLVFLPSSTPRSALPPSRAPKPATPRTTLRRARATRKPENSIPRRLIAFGGRECRRRKGYREGGGCATSPQTGSARGVDSFRGAGSQISPAQGRASRRLQASVLGVHGKVVP